MIREKRIVDLPKSIFNELGWEYYISEDAKDYLANDLVRVSEKEADGFYRAGNALYPMLVDAAEYILRNDLLGTTGIPANLHQIIRYTWENDHHFHLFGRFDFAGGIDDLPVKLLEFNADTPTTLPETAVLQWLQLKANHMNEEAQMNFVYDALVENFKRLKNLNRNKDPFILFSTMSDAPEDNNNVALLMEAAYEAGFEVSFKSIEEVIFSESDGIFANNENGDPVNYPFWFKLIPWEYIAVDEPELAEILTKIVTAEKAVVLNPAYTMLFQSKAILKYLWELYPKNEYLLESDFKKLRNKTFVEKVVLGREGANVRIVDENGGVIEEEGGDYDDQLKVYQEYAPLAKDFRGNFYQAGVFFAYEACGLGFRRNNHKILNNSAQFVGHYID